MGMSGPALARPQTLLGGGCGAPSGGVGACVCPGLPGGEACGWSSAVLVPGLERLGRCERLLGEPGGVPVDDRGLAVGAGCAVVAQGVAVPPGVVAPERAPRLQGLARVGGACVGGSHGSGRCDRCPRRRVVRRGRWTGTGHRGGAGPPGVAALAVLARPDRLPGGAGRVVGALCGCWWPRPTMRPARTGPVTKAVQRGAPCRVGTWV